MTRPTPVGRPGGDGKTNRAEEKMVERSTHDYSPVYGYLRRPSLVDFPGRLAAVMFTAGCNFRCGFCHNARLLGHTREGLPWERLATTCREFREQWVDGVVVTGGEPTLWENELLVLLEMLRGFGFAIKLDTNGSRPDVLKKAAPLVDYVAMDVKCGLERHPEFVHFDSPEKIGDSVAFVKEHIPEHEFRTTVIEHVHTDEEMRAICSVIRGAKRYVLQPFLPREDLLDPQLRTAPRTSPDRLAYLRDYMADCAEEVVAQGE